MEIIVEDFISGQQEQKVVPDDTVFISKNGQNYYQGDTIYKVVSDVIKTKETNDVLIGYYRIPYNTKIEFVYEFIPLETITAEDGYVINTAYGYEINKKQDRYRYRVFFINDERIPRDENLFKQLMEKYAIHLPEERRSIW
jgi:hypothetical protein